MTTLDSRPAIHHAASNVPAPDASNSRPTKGTSQPIGFTSGGPTSPAAIPPAAPNEVLPQGTSTTGGQGKCGDQNVPAAGSDKPDPAAKDGPPPILGSLLDPALCLAADVLDDIERVRIANDNRLRQLVRTETDSDGEERGFGLDPDHPDVMRLGVMIETLKKVEHEATLELQRKMRKHPLGDWVKAQRGVGLKQGARLLAAIGDPYINSAKGQPRTVSALWAYCGLHVLLGGQGPDEIHGSTAAGDQHRDTDQVRHDAHSIVVGVAAKRRKGERANWSTKAKMRAHLVAESCIKQLDQQCRDGHCGIDAQNGSAAPACACSPYRVAYDKRRAHTALTRPEWTDGHSHNDALRVASKEILKDLWRAARDWHLAQPG